MDKLISISKDNNDTIVLRVNEVEKLKVLKNNREINAEEIYDCFSYKVGDTYEVKQLDENTSESDVLKTFENLISEIAQTLNDFTSSSAVPLIVSDESDAEELNS